MTTELEEHISDEKGISDDTRFEVLSRDNWRCRRCGEQDVDKLHPHHVVFRSQGGSHKAINLVTVCWWCHRLIHDGKVLVSRIEETWFFGYVKHWRRRLRT